MQDLEVYLIMFLLVFVGVIFLNIVGKALSKIITPEKKERFYEILERFI